ncbi:MAG TPA: hypothetical protein VG890_05360 [Puia sp.]|nr:hypothetical protein [Puia sp.]
MKRYLSGILVLLICCAGMAQSADNIDRPAFYQAMQGDKKDLVNAQLQAIRATGGNTRQAFEGALTMKKAGLGGSPAQKLKLFKAGHQELEAAIKQEPGNAEFRFLRLMIQEHAPDILGYNSDLRTDSEFIKKTFDKLPETLQKAITDYSKKSKVLKLQVS